MMNFEILITSPPDRDELVGEIWYNDQMIAEINQEKNDFEIEFYLKKNITFNYVTFISALEETKEKLGNASDLTL